MRVDYVQQMMEILRGIMAKAEATKSLWQDEVANRYYREYIEYYDDYSGAWVLLGRLSDDP